MQGKYIEYILKDPDVKLNDFEKYYERLSGKNLLPSARLTVEKSEGFSISNPALTKFQIRGATVRPGFRSSFLNEKLRNEPNEYREYEEFNPDAIPLKTYKKISLDPQIALGMFLLKGWVGGLKYSVESSDPQIQAVVRYALDKIWAELIRNSLDALIYGFQFAEKIWQREDVELDDFLTEDEKKTIFSGKIVTYKKIKFLDPDQGFKYYKDTNDEISRVVQRQRARDVSVNRDKLFWFALDKKHSGIFGTSRLKSVYEVWYYTKLNYQYLLKDNEKRGAPHLEVRYPMGATLVDGELMGNDELAVRLVEMLQSQGAVMLPSEETEKGNPKWSVKYADNRQINGDSPFLKFIEFSDRKKLQAIGIPDSVLVSGSNFSMADAGGDMLVVIIEDIVNQLEDAIQKDIVEPLVEYNWGPKYISKVRLTIDKSGLGRRRLFKEILINMMRIAASMPGDKPKAMPDIARMCEDMGIPVSVYNQIFNENVKGTTETSEKSPLQEIQEEEDNNNPYYGRPNVSDQSGQDRKSAQRDAKDTF
jgi:hypothetical protein